MPDAALTRPPARALGPPALPRHRARGGRAARSWCSPACRCSATSSAPRPGSSSASPASLLERRGQADQRSAPAVGLNLARLARARVARRRYHPRRRPGRRAGGRADGRRARARRVHRLLRHVAAHPPSTGGAPSEARARRSCSSRSSGSTSLTIIVGRRSSSASSGATTTSSSRRTSSSSTPGSTCPGPLDINKGVLYLVIAGDPHGRDDALHRQPHAGAPEPRADRGRDALRVRCATTSRAATWTTRWPRKWFPFIGTLFLFIWFSNLIGYIPLPTNTQEKVDIFGVEIPAFAIYAATANISIPLVLALVVFVSYNVEGIRAKGFIGYLKSLIPAGRARRRMAVPHLHPRAGLELHAADLALRPTVRQHPRRPPDHPVHVRRPRGAARARGARRGSRCRSASRSSSSRSAWWRPCRRSSSPRSLPSTSAARSPSTTSPKEHSRAVPPSSSPSSPRRTTAQTPARRSPSASAAASAPSAPASASASSSARSSSRSPASPRCATRSPSIQWLGFALTEACFFYGLVAGLIAFFL